MVNINDAPEGFYAEKATMLCVGCAFFNEEEDDDNENCYSVTSCDREDRPDRENVIFKKKE